MSYYKSGLAVIAVATILVVVVFLLKDFMGFRKTITEPDGGSPSSSNVNEGQLTETFPIHRDVIMSIFWVGENETYANDFISNAVSAWDDNWQDHFGGVDDPENRNGYLPADFVPQENPFYFALPYDDFDSQGNRKPQAYDIVYWATEKNWNSHESMCKNQWLKISKGGKDAYAQWEDVGPFEENDSNYVFGNAGPKNVEKSASGLDVSPAVRDYLELSGIDKADWQFVRESAVPDGPWKQIVTTRNGN